MGGIVSFKDVINKALAFEERLEQYYIEIRDTTENEGVRMITYYLSRHRRRLQKALDELPQTTRDHLFKMTFKHDIEFTPEQDFHPLTMPVSEIQGESLIEAGVNYDLQLVDVYKKILELPMNKEASAFVEGLIRMEEKDVVMLKKMLATHYF
jgi:rubrerythrin